jgi:hypothetical protein
MQIAEDEGRHAVGPERLWNESWYFDVVDEGAELGAYVRLGLYPNLGVAWYTAFVTGRGRPCVSVVDLAAPLPLGSKLTARTGAYEAALVCETPGERFHVTLAGSGVAHADHAAPLRGEPADVALDLRWETDGEPYRYTRATRYEIPCLVSGTVTVGGEELAVRGPGQRDHSWGVRDWWAADWVWSAGRLADRRRLHALEMRLRDGRRLGVGYLQGAGTPLTELRAVSAEEEVADSGLITAARIAVDPGAVRVDLEPLAFGALRFTSEDGRVNQFPRAMCRFRTGDGESGLGWVEWSRNLP